MVNQSLHCILYQSDLSSIKIFQLKIMTRYLQFTFWEILTCVSINSFAQNNKFIKDSLVEGCILFFEPKPEFMGGEDTLFNFLKLNTKYPKEAGESCIEGTVYIGFTVETDGTFTGIKIKRGLGGGCSEEALRVVQLMPKWKPGKQQGRAVRVAFTIPVKFKLE